MKHLLIGDTHLGYKNGSDEYHNICLALFEQVCEYAQLNDIKTLIHLGDFFDIRKALPVKTIPIAYKIINMCQGTFRTTYLIVGNHDTYYKSQLNPTSLEIFKDIENIFLVERPIILNNIHLQPWLVEEFKSCPECDYLMGHFELSGITINRVGTESKSGLPISLFKDYKKVFSGHYHTKSETKNITYLGSPFHMTFNDEGKRGFYEFDDVTGNLEFIEFDNYPKFEIFTHENIDFDKIKGNNVRITFTNDIGTTKINNINNKVMEKEPNQLFVEFAFEESFSDDKNDVNIEDVLSIRMIENKYLDNAEIPEYINREKIDKKMDGLWEELKN